MNPNEQSLLLRAKRLYLRQWTNALVHGDSVTLRFYAHRLDEVRMCHETKSISDEFRCHLAGLFQSRASEDAGVSKEPPSFKESDEDRM